MHTPALRTLFLSALLLVVAVGGFAPIYTEAQQGGVSKDQQANTAAGDLRQLADVSKNEPANNFGCFGGNNDITVLQGCVTLMFWKFMGVTAALAMWVGTGLNWIIQYLVIGMGQLVGNIPGITIAWAVLRDLANVFLVFITVFIGMSMIVGASTYGSKQMLFKVVIAALFVNFSITLTKAVIDVTNIFTVATYTMLLSEAERGNPSATVKADICVKSPFNSGKEPQDDPCVHTGVAGLFISKLKILTILNFNASQTQHAAETVMWTSLMGSIMFLVMAFVFGAAAILLAIRFAVLVVLLIFSPIAFVLWITGVSGQGRRWWETLLQQAFLAPALLLMWWIAYMVFTGFDAIFPNKNGLAGASLNDGTASINPIAIVTLFFILIAIFIMSLIVARSMAKHGGAMLVSATDRYAKRAGVGTWGATKWTGRKANMMRVTAQDRALGTRDQRYAAAFEPDKKTGGKKTDIFSTTRRAIAGSKYDQWRAKKDAEAKKPITDNVAAKDARMKQLTAEQAKAKVGAAAGLAGEYGEKTGADLRAAVQAKTNKQGTDLDAEVAKVEEARKTIAGLTKKDAEDIHDQLMKNVGAVIHMSAAQIQTIMSSDAYTDEEKEKIRTTKYAEEIGIIGQKGPLNANQSAKMNALGNKDLDLLRQEFIRNTGRAEDLNGDQMDYVLNKSEAYSTQEKATMRTDRFAKLQEELDKVKAGPNVKTDALEKELNKLSDKEAELLEQQFIEDQIVLESMPQRVAEKVMASPRIANATKSKVKTGRSAYFGRVAASGATGVRGVTAKKIMTERSAADVAKIDGEQLSKPEYGEHMNVAILSAAAGTLNPKQKADVRAHLNTLIPPVRRDFDAAVARELSSVMTPGRTTPITQLEEAAIKRKAMATLNPDKRRMIEVDDWLNSTTAGAVF